MCTHAGVFVDKDRETEDQLRTEVSERICAPYLSHLTSWTQQRE